MKQFAAMVVILFSLSFVRASEARNPVDLEVDFWEKRQDRDPADYITPEKLGEAYLQKSRESGNLSFLMKAEKALKKSLAIKPRHTQAMNWLCLAMNQPTRQA